MMRLLFIVSLCLSAPTIANAELTLPQFFSDSMVLQRDRPVAIWGTASPSAKVSVTFREKSTSTLADDQGNWRVDFASGPASSEGTTINVQSGEDQVTISDVLVGEVWIASGQSNMAFTMNRVPAYQELITKSDHPSIRMFNAATVTAVKPQSDIDGQWTRCSPQTVPNYSAVAFFFARKLHLELGVPIGVIKTAWGGKPVETFTSREALMTLPGTRTLVEKALAEDAAYDEVQAREIYQSRLEKWQTAFVQWKAKPADQRGNAPRKPDRLKRALDTEGKPGVLFNSMIHPFIGYTLRGAIWYQGEGNAKPGAVPYDQTLPLMIQDWRTRWDDDFSFYFVQLANFREPSTAPGTADSWALLQDRMRMVLDTTPRTGMAVINDVGEAKDIHPKNKQDPGERLALWALAKDYDRNVVYSGPLYESCQRDGSAMRVTFTSVGSGLKSRDGEPLQRFEIAGADKVWHWADVKIVAKDSVLLSCPDVDAPVAVRYAWAANPESANLVNSEGLPTSVFRSDDWDDVEVSSAPSRKTRAPAAAK
jgi:sialate O-acetylesterase